MNLFKRIVDDIKKSKARTAMAIAIGLVTFVFFAVVFIQVKTVSIIDISAIETMRESELREELSSWKSKYDEVSSRLNETDQIIEAYKKDIQNNSETSEVLKDELKLSEMYLGKKDVQGEGIIITLKDTDNKQIISEDLLSLVNELRLAGAEAISINDERIVSRTDIVNIESRFIMINGKRMNSPFVIKAIGNKKYLESSITIKGGFIDEMEANEKSVSYEISDKVIINKTTVDYSSDYIK